MERGEIHARIGLPLFFKEFHHYRFGIDADELLSKSTVEEINIARMDPEAVVDHREMTYSVAVEPIDRQHHVCGIQRMNEVSDDAIGCFLESIFRVSSTS